MCHISSFYQASYQKLNPKKDLPDGYFLTDKNIPGIAATEGLSVIVDTNT